MPEINKILEIPQMKGLDVYKTSIQALQKIGAEVTSQEIESETPFSAKISAFIPSIWGWGGMKIKIQLREEKDVSRLSMVGYIAQLATGPLTEKVDAFLEELSSLLNQEYGYQLRYSPTKKFFQFQGLKWTRKDTILIIVVFLGVGLILLFSLLLKIPETILGSIIILLAYYFARKLLRKK